MTCSIIVSNKDTYFTILWVKRGAMSQLTERGPIIFAMLAGWDLFHMRKTGLLLCFCFFFGGGGGIQSIIFISSFSLPLWGALTCLKFCLLGYVTLTSSIIQINITAILIQHILACQAKIVLFITFWTNIEPCHMFYIIILVTLKYWQNMGIVFIQLLLEFYHILFIMNLKPNNFEQTSKIVLLFLKS